MSKIVFVLGAGASAHCGTPLMNNFLDVARDLLEAEEVEEAREDFERVFKAIGNLRETQSKAILDIHNIETVFSAFEMGKLLGRIPGVEESSKIDELISSIKKVIVYTLEKTTKLRRTEIIAPEAYYEFAGIIETLIEAGKDCSVITFNYDLGLDFSLYARKIVPDYGLSDIPLTARKIVTYLKLHGSLNWGKCSKCGKITPYRDITVIETTSGLDYSILPIISKLKTLKCKCGEPLEEDPIIIPPTWNKTAYHKEIGVVWQRAAKELKDAETIFILGYSLPDTDWFFNYLFALGVDMRTHIKGFYVYNSDPLVAERFRDILGQDVIQRFFPYAITFEDAVKRVAPENTGIGIKTIPQILHIKDDSSAGPTSFVPRGR